MKILVIAAHPDDMEFGCAGTIAKFIGEGAKIDLLIVVGPGEEITPGRNKQIVEAELEASLDILGLKWKTLSSKLKRPHIQCSPAMVTKIDKLFGDNHYDLVITNDPGDFHQDHVETFKLANSFCRKDVNELWTMEVLPYSNRNTTFTPNVFVDIEDHFDAKLHMISCYESLNLSAPDFANISALAKYRAIQIPEASYAEAFQQYFRKIR